MHKKLFIVTPIAIVGVICLTVWGYQHYSERKLKAKIGEAIQKNVAYAEGALDPARRTTGEVISKDLWSESIDGTRGIAAELRAFPATSPLRERLIDFLEAQNEVVRAKADMYGKALAVVLATEAWKGQRDFARQFISSPGWQLRLGLMDELSGQITETALQLEASCTRFLDLYQKVLKLEADLLNDASRVRVPFPPTFQKYEKANTKEAQEYLQFAKHLSGRS